MQQSRRPLIGVTGSMVETGAGVKGVSLGEAYLAAVRAAGGLPVILPPAGDTAIILETLERVDGLVFTGGRDVDPCHFGEPALNETVQPEPERDAFELPLAREAVARDVPLLAICRGVQVLNVALGGSLWQDLPAQRAGGLVHRQTASRDTVTHTVQVVPDTLLARTLDASGAVVATNTFHHQAVRAVPHGLIVAATASDGTVEAVEAPGRRFVLGVQWHPENLQAGRAEHRRLFQALVAAARAAATRRRVLVA